MINIRRILLLTALVILATPIFTGGYLQAARATGTVVDPALAKALSGTATIQFVVTYDHKPTSSDASFLQNLGVKYVVLDQLPMALVIGAPSQAQSVIQQPGIRSVWNNNALTYYRQVNTANHDYGTVPVSTSWWIDTMNVRSAWTQGARGTGVGVAIVDSGVDATNPSLGYNFPNGQSYASKRVIQNVKVVALSEIVFEPPIGPDQLYIENLPNTDTTGGHGTGTSSSAAGTGLASDGVYLGVAPEANVVGLSAGDAIAVFYAVASFNYILAHRAQYNIRVNSNSWGPGSDCSSCFDPSDPVNVATRQMHDAGIAVLFSAGNSGPGDGTISGYAVQPWVIGVAASQMSKGLTNFSSRGFAADSNTWPTITAPGEDTIAAKASTGVTDNSLNTPEDLGNVLPQYQQYYTTFGGTSAASPLTAGIAALVLSANPSLNPDQVKTVISATADPMPGYLAFQDGAGHVNAGRAVQYARTGSYKPGTIKLENRGIEAYNFQAFEAAGREVPLASTPIDNDFPTFTGAQSFNVQVSWQLPSTTGWLVNLWSPNDKNTILTINAGLTSVGLVSTPGSTSLSFSFDGASKISSYYNLGQSMGTWVVRVRNTGIGEKYTVNVQVVYSNGGSMHLGNGQNNDDSHNVQVSDQSTSNALGSIQAVFQAYDGTVQGVQSLGSSNAGTSLGLTAKLSQPQGQVVQVVQVVTVDANGNVLQFLDGWVTTQSDIQTRITQVQTALLTATPTQTITLNNELAALNKILTTAPITENLPTI